jgi:hypothetical protein
MNGGFESYGEMFEFDLHEMSNASEYTRRDWFAWWLARSSFDSVSCEPEFTATAAATEEGDEFLCPRCAAKR